MEKFEVIYIAYDNTQKQGKSEPCMVHKYTNGINCKIICIRMLLRQATKKHPKGCMGNSEILLLSKVQPNNNK